MRVSGRLLAFLSLISLIALSACADTREASRAGPDSATYKVGKAYQIGGKWYYPAEDFDYDETGIASWYGSQFHGRHTANGEIFDRHSLSAAHTTLPLPTMVRVTNLDNGRSMVLRVNDRGPFVRGRIIDVSERAAEELGFHRQGTAKVRVQVLADESRMLAAAGKTQTLSVAERADAAPVTAVASASLPPPGSASAPAPPVEPAPAPSRRTVRQAAAEPAVMSDARPVVSVKPVTRSDIYVQAGSFEYLDNAHRLAAKLAPLGPTRVTPVRISGRDLYRVFVGPAGDVASADALLDRVIGAGQYDAKIVVN